MDRYRTPPPEFNKPKKGKTMKKKVVYNQCWGGFSLSRKAVELGRKLSGDEKWADITLGGEPYDDGSGVASMDYDDSNYPDSDFPRHDKILVQVVETLGKSANGGLANLVVYELEGTKYFNRS